LGSIPLVGVFLNSFNYFPQLFTNCLLVWRGLGRSPLRDKTLEMCINEMPIPVFAKELLGKEPVSSFTWRGIHWQKYLPPISFAIRDVRDVHGTRCPSPSLPRGRNYSKMMITHQGSLFACRKKTCNRKTRNYPPPPRPSRKESASLWNTKPN
jgi:hypothetical protein